MATRTGSSSRSPARSRPGSESRASRVGRSAKPCVLITGASAGIGAALAECFAARGHDLLLVARSADKLEALSRRLAAGHGVRAEALPCDLAAPGAVAALAAGLRRRRRRVDVLVNNAGVLHHGPFVKQGAEAAAAMVALNVHAPTQLAAEFVPAMVARGGGRVLNVASIAAFQPVPQLATYAATKAFVLAFTEALAEELRGSGVTVTALCPGITATGMLEGAQRESAGLKKLPGFVVGDVDAVAAEGVEACLAGEVIRVPGALNQAAVLAGRATPRGLLRRVSGALTRRLG
jgi:hypothetical protein